MTHHVRVRGRLLVLVLPLLLVASASARPHAAHAQCGSITARLGGNDFTYRVRVVSGHAACIRARTVMRVFIVHASTPRGWLCSRGHSRDAWAASCARLTPRALVRAYLIAG
jgi:hypothetical protein